MECSGKCFFFLRLASHTFPHMLRTGGISTFHHKIWVGIFLPPVIGLPLQHSSHSRMNSDVFCNCVFLGESSVKHSECLCDGSTCSDGDRCFGQQCFTSLSILNGTSVLQKGCIVGNEEGPLSCGSPPTPELMIECCSGDLCNMNISLNSLVKGKCDLFIIYCRTGRSRFTILLSMFGNVFVMADPFAESCDVWSIDIWHFRVGCRTASLTRLLQIWKIVSQICSTAQGSFP